MIEFSISGPDWRREQCPLEVSANQQGSSYRSVQRNGHHIVPIIPFYFYFLCFSVCLCSCCIAMPLHRVMFLLGKCSIPASVAVTKKFAFALQYFSWIKDPEILFQWSLSSESDDSSYKTSNDFPPPPTEEELQEMSPELNRKYPEPPREFLYEFPPTSPESSKEPPTPSRKLVYVRPPNVT